MTVFFSSAGRRVELMQCFRQSATALGMSVQIGAGDARPELSAACHQADFAVQLPRCTDAEFIPRLLETCINRRVKILIPTIDTELAVLAEHVSRFADAGVDVMVSSPSVIQIARDKAKCSQCLAEAGISTPKTLSGPEFLSNPKSQPCPVIIKPRHGSSSIGVVLPLDLEEAIRVVRQGAKADLIVQEKWTGQEYTINMYIDRAGEMRCAVPHLRIETRGGEVSKGRTENVPVLRDVARQIAKALPGARGALCFQAIVKADGSYAVFEINARFGGGYPLAHQAGAPFAQWLLEEAAGLPTTANDNWRPGVTMLRYDAAVFRDE